MINNQAVDQMVVYVTERILFRDEKIIQRKDGSLIAFYDNIRLSCGLHDGSCESTASTYYWKVASEKHCPLYSVKHFRGEIITSSAKSGKVLSSTDNSLVRFVIKDSFEICQQRVMRTNYKEIVIADTRNSDGSPKHGLVTRPLPDDKISLSIFITNRDDTLYHKARERIRKEFSSIIRDDCRANLDKTKTQHFLERKMPDFRSYRLGGSNYATTAGEITYFYKCKPRLTVAVETATCFDALPVEIVPDPMERVSEPSSPNPTLFIEPVTHRISQTAQEIPCIPRFFSRYKDLFGRWFALTPKYERTDPPKVLNVQMINRAVNISDDEPDFSQGGVYNSEDIDSLQRYLELGRLQQAVSYKLAAQAGNLDPGQYITPSNLFPSHTLPGGSWHAFILGKIWGSLRSLGEIASVGIATFMIGRLIWYLLKVLMNCHYLYKSHGCTAYLAWAMCTEVLFAYHYRRAQVRKTRTRRRQRRQQQEFSFHQDHSDDKQSARHGSACLRCWTRDSSESDSSYERDIRAMELDQRPPSSPLRARSATPRRRRRERYQRRSISCDPQPPLYPDVSGLLPPPGAGGTTFPPGVSGTTSPPEAPQDLPALGSLVTSEPE